MGLDLNGARFLLYARRLGVNFERTAMIGRQSLDLTKIELRDTFRAFGNSVDAEVIDQIYSKSMGYSESLFKYLGAKNINSFDASAYEGATHVYDMNREIPSEFMEQYSVVLDGGSMEHIFNFPIAIKNCMEMLEIGGHYLGVTPANNFMGHGFYQFSPETYFSVFTRQNGFELISLIAFEDRPRAMWYSVRSPKEIRGRVLLVNDQPVYLLVVAKRITKAVVFDSIPQQSDYLGLWNGNKTVSEWTSSNTQQSMEHTSLRNWVKRNLPFPVRHLLRSAIHGYGFNPNFFTPMDPTDAKRLPKE